MYKKDNPKVLAMLCEQVPPFRRKFRPDGPMPWVPRQPLHPQPRHQARHPEEITHKLVQVDQPRQQNHVVAHPGEGEPVDPSSVRHGQLEGRRPQRLGEGEILCRRRGIDRGSLTTRRPLHQAVVAQGRIDGPGRPAEEAMVGGHRNAVAAAQDFPW